MKKRYLKYPAIIILLCSVTCGSTEELKKEDREKAILGQYSMVKQEKFSNLLVNLNNYTTNGRIYQKKYHRHLIGVAGDIVEKKNLRIVDETIGFYFDKKSNNRNRLFLGLDIDTEIAFCREKDFYQGEPFSAGIFDISEDEDKKSDPLYLMKQEFIKQISRSVRFNLLSEDDKNRGLILNGFQKEKLKDRDSILRASRSLKLERCFVFETKEINNSVTLFIRVYNSGTGKILKEINYVFSKDADFSEESEKLFKEIPSDRYFILEEFRDNVPDYNEAAAWFLKNKLRSIMETLSSCESVFSEKEVVGMVIGFRWIRNGRKESVNIWINEQDLLLIEKNKLAFTELLQRSTITDSFGKIIRLPI